MKTHFMSPNKKIKKRTDMFICLRKKIAVTGSNASPACKKIIREKEEGIL